jgi:predicted  nucleic acid-binding Zn-ribbon protein
MLDVIEKLLVLQDRDRKIIRTQKELSGIGPQRESMLAKAAGTQSALEAAKLKARQIESDRKKLELEADTLKQRADKYATQQLQTKKNEEYRALAHEIDNCKAAIVKLEDQQIEFMEQAEVAQKEVIEAGKIAADLKKLADGQIAELGVREQNLKQQLAELQSNRTALATAVQEDALAKYDRLLKHKGDNIVVGIEHSVCGGCHMKLPTQVIISCQGDSEINSCPHCGRIIYYSRDMELTVVD